MGVKGFCRVDLISEFVCLVFKHHRFWFIVTTPTQPQFNSKVGFDMKMTLIHQPPTTTHQELNVGNISAVMDPILSKLEW